MKTAIYASILLVVCMVVGSLYLIYDTNRFTREIKSRRVIPTNESTATNSSSKTSDIEDEKPEQTEQAEQTIEPDKSVSKYVQGHNTQDIDTVPATELSDGLDDFSLFSFDGQDKTEESEQQETNFHDLSLEQIIENNRKHLISVHGDIPEVHTYLKYFPFEALLEENKDKEYSLDLSLEENLKYYKAVAHLFPSKSNTDNYLNALKMYENFKSDDHGYHEDN